MTEQGVCSSATLPGSLITRTCSPAEGVMFVSTPLGGFSEQHPGFRLRLVRNARGLSVRGLAAAAGVSPSFLSQFERGLTDASVGNLRKLAQAVGVNTAELFDDSPLPNRHLVQSQNRRVISADLGTVKYLVSTPFLQSVEVYTGEISPGGVSAEAPYTHGSSTEILLVTEGDIIYELDGESLEMGPGDSIEHSTALPHRLINAAEAIAHVVWIISPPSSGLTEGDSQEQLRDGDRP